MQKLLAIFGGSKALPAIFKFIGSLFAVFLAWRIYIALRDKAHLDKIKHAYDTQSGTGNDGTQYNIHAATISLWAACYDDVTEDEEAIINIISNCPEARFRELNADYNKYLIDNKSSRHWYNYHYGKTLQEDCKYFLQSADYTRISHLFNSL